MTITPDIHRQLAVEANNATWELLGSSPTSPSVDDADEMVRCVSASGSHWVRAEGSSPANIARAEWLISRVWAVRSDGALALRHGQRCLGTCESAGLGDFDLAYAHEAVARVSACLGDMERACDHLRRANGVAIADAEDRELFEADLAAPPWFGLG